MSIRLNVHDLHALSRQFRHSHQKISDLMLLLHRHLHVLLSSVSAAKISEIDQAQSEMEHELKGFLHTLDDLEHLLRHTEIRMKKTDQMLAARLFQSGGHLAGYPHIMSFLAASKHSADNFKMTASLTCEPLILLKQLKENGLSGLFTGKRTASYVQFDDRGKRQLWSVRRLLSRKIARNLCLLAYQQAAKGPLSYTGSAFSRKAAEADASDLNTVCLHGSQKISASALAGFSEQAKQERNEDELASTKA
ncbi:MULTISPECIES: hypothetical protein [Bacillus]|uniref:hypothetical protein n=1 Tax=Bacillus TaxID=1386 RepID=UPI0004028CC9|nr:MULTISPECIES: hypothetical protein [Bacillus]